MFKGSVFRNIIREINVIVKYHTSRKQGLEIKMKDARTKRLDLLAQILFTVTLVQSRHEKTSQRSPQTLNMFASTKIFKTENALT